MSASEPPGGNPRWGSPGQAPSLPGQWTSPPGPPQKKRRGRGCLWGCAGALVAVVVIVIVALVIAAGDKDESTTSAPSTTPSAKTEQGQTREPARRERADLLSFQLDDRSQAGFSNIWLVWTIKNTSSEKSNYSWDWEAVDAGGTRVEDGSQWETNVQPGQTARGEYPTTLKTVKGIKLNVTSFNRTASY